MLDIYRRQAEFLALELHQKQLSDLPREYQQRVRLQAVVSVNRGIKQMATSWRK